MTEFAKRSESESESPYEVSASFIASEAHAKIGRAKRTDQAMDTSGVDNSRRYLIHSGGGLVLPVTHVRFGLQPAVRDRQVANVRFAIVRVPIEDIEKAPASLKGSQSERLTSGGGTIDKFTVPTNDVAIEAVLNSGQVHRFMISPEGLMAYDEGGDIEDAVNGRRAKGYLFMVKSTLETSIAQQELEASGINSSTVMDLMNQYELFPQSNELLSKPEYPGQVA